MRISDWSSDVCSSDLRLFREIADIDAETAGGGHERAVRLHRLIIDDGIFDRHVDDLPVRPRDHAIELPGSDEVDGMDAERRSHPAVAPGRHGAPLHIAEPGAPRLAAGSGCPPPVHILPHIRTTVV